MTLAAYQDILYQQRPVSKHPKMSVENRAKLFTPFSAPRGFDIEILTTEQDRLLVVLPEGHPLAELEKIPVSAITEEPFLLLKNGENADALEIFGRSMSAPKVRFTSEDGFAVLAMVENGLGISILPELILKRGSRRIVSRELEIPVYRNLGIGWQEKQSASLAVKRFMEYLKYR